MLIHTIAAALATTCSAADYGAVGDGVTDDRPALQAAINACAVVEIPAGRYLVTRAPFVYANLLVPTGRTVSGVGRGGTTLVQAAGQGPNVRLLHVAGADVTIEDLSLDGDRAHQTPDEHRAGVFATASPRLVLRRVVARNFAGDGLYLHRGSHDATLDEVEAADNDRNGLSLGGGTRGALVTRSTFARNGVQQIDSEPSGADTVDQVTIADCVIDGTGSNDYALTISGAGPDVRSSGWTVVDNAIIGSVHTVWADGVVVARNQMQNATTKSCLEVYLRCVGVAILDNVCEQTQQAVDGVAGIYIAGARVGDMPTGVVVNGNVIKVTGRAKSFGVRAEGCVSVYIGGNQFFGPSVGAPGYPGVYVRTTILGVLLRSAVVVDNTIAGWPEASVRVVGNGAAKIEYLEISDNTIDAAVEVGDDAVPVVQRRTGNRCTGTCPGANLP